MRDLDSWKAHYQSCDHPELRIVVRNRRRYQCVRCEGIFEITMAFVEVPQWLVQESVLQLKWFLKRYGSEELAAALREKTSKIDGVGGKPALDAVEFISRQLAGTTGAELPEGEEHEPDAGCEAPAS